MSDKEKIVQLIKRYQVTGSFHPLTCREQSSHKLLEPEILDDNVVLRCPTCDYVQIEEHIPDMFLDVVPFEEMLDRMDEQWKEIREILESKNSTDEQ